MLDMAELLAYCEPGDEPRQGLRLLINWLQVTPTPDVPGGLSSIFEFGLFLGDAPLFDRSAYAREDGPAASLREGYFYGESEDCQILRDLREVLATGRIADIEDVSEPAIRLVIGRDIMGRGKAGDGEPPDFFEMLVVVQAGGPWAGRIRGPNGPAVWLEVERSALERFCDQLQAEAIRSRMESGN